MLQKDYIMRMIEQLSQVLAKIMFAKQAKNFDEALQIAQNAYGELFGLQGEMVDKLEGATLAQLLNDKEKIKGLAALLHEEGNVLVVQGNLNEGRARYSKALGLYEAALKMQETADKDSLKAVEVLWEKLRTELK